MTAILNPQPMGTDDRRSSSLDPDLAGCRLDQLRRQTRRLWNNDPDLGPSEREPVIVELTDIDLRLERLAMRSRWTELDERDVQDLADCSYRLSRLEAHWTAH